MMLVTTYKRK